MAGEGKKDYTPEEECDKKGEFTPRRRTFQRAATIEGSTFQGLSNDEDRVEKV